MYSRYEPQTKPDSSLIDALLSEQASSAFFSPLDHDMEVFILRHGQSEGNARNTFQGRLDFPLSTRGEEQAKAAGEWLADERPDCVIASPLRRARETAEIIARQTGLGHVEIDDTLIEVDVGLFSGISPAIAEQKYPEIWSAFQTKSWDAVPDAESSRTMYARAILAWKRIREQGLRGASRVLCVTHGGLLQWIMKSTMGAHDWLPLLPMSNCGISQYEIKAIKKDSPVFVQWTKINFHPPLAPEGPKPVF